MLLNSVSPESLLPSFAFSIFLAILGSKSFSSRSRFIIFRSDLAILRLAVSALSPAPFISRLRAFTCTLNLVTSALAFLSAISAFVRSSASSKSLLVSLTSTSAAPSAASAASSRLRAVAKNPSALSRNPFDRCTNFSASLTSLSAALIISGVDTPASCIDSRRCAAFASNCFWVDSNFTRLSTWSCKSAECIFAICNLPCFVFKTLSDFSTAFFASLLSCRTIFWTPATVVASSNLAVNFDNLFV